MRSVFFRLIASVGLLSSGALGQQPLIRTAASTLRLSSTAPAARFSTPRVFPTLSFVQPVALVSPPGDSRRLFVVEKPGRIWVIADVTAANPTRTLFLDLTSRVATSTSSNDERGLLALAFHPNYAVNGQFYLWYTTTTTTSAGSGAHNRLSRFLVSSANPQLAVLGSEQPLISQRDEAGNHNGGEILFGPDGYLYLSVGDEGGGDDAYGNSQRIDRDFFSGILRLDVDRRAGSLAPNPHAAVHAGSYSIPPDNPFVGSSSFNAASVVPSAVRTEFWAVGLRNPWRMSFDPATGQLWCADVGQGAREEIDLIVRGGNYGWSYREGTIAGPRGSPPASVSFVPPIWDYPRSLGQSVTGGILYRGAGVAALYGHYVFADFASGRIWSLRPNGTQPVGDDRVQLLATDAGIGTFGLNPATGDILLADLLDGAIKQLVATPATGGTAIPPTLSATGAFTSTASLTPAPGMVAYEPTVSFWSDHAKKRRWFALPDTTGAFGFSAEGAWSLPTGAVWVKHFDLELRRGDPTSARRIETRILVKTSSDIYGLTYRWNDAQTDAELVPDAGANQTIAVTEDGAARSQTWRYPSRAECLMCHTAAGGYALSFNTRQLNRDRAFPGGNAHTIAALSQAGYFSSTASAPSPVDPARLPALAAATDLSKPLELRARSYLDANCSQCHRPGGTALGSWDARATVDLAAAGIVNGVLVDQGGDPANRVVVPGDAVHSRLLQRMSGTGASRMPPVASSERDAQGETLLADWIASLAAPAQNAPLTNLSSRARVTAGAQILITGFTIQGTAAKRVLIRAVGPGLAPFQVPATLPQPALTLFQGSSAIGSNFRWGTAPNAAEIRATAHSVGAFALEENGNDSALLTTLSPGGYTAHAVSGGNTSGVALIEVYDADLASPDDPLASRFVNVSIRAEVRAGADILIPGLTIGEGSSQKLLIRAVGPGLNAFQVPGTLNRPTLQLYRRSEIVAGNTRWNSAANAAEIRTSAQRVGAFALAEGSADSALLVSLGTGAYTIHVSGAENTTGIALVEIYEVP